MQKSKKIVITVISVSLLLCSFPISAQSSILSKLKTKIEKDATVEQQEAHPTETPEPVLISEESDTPDTIVDKGLNFLPEAIRENHLYLYGGMTGVILILSILIFLLARKRKKPLVEEAKADDIPIDSDTTFSALSLDFKEEKKDPTESKMMQPKPKAPHSDGEEK